MPNLFKGLPNVTPTPAPTWSAQGDNIKYYVELGNGPNYTDDTVSWIVGVPPPFYPGVPIYGIIRKGGCTLPFVNI
jgi:hypothetical protein